MLSKFPFYLKLNVSHCFTKDYAHYQIDCSRFCLTTISPGQNKILRDWNIGRVFRKLFMPGKQGVYSRLLTVILVD